MSIPLDIEDILGSALVASVGRALAAFSCLWLGAATGIMGMHVGWGLSEVLAGNSVDVGELFARTMVAMAFGVLVLFGSIYLPLFFPLVFAVFFLFVRGETATVRKWVVVAALTGLLCALSVHSWMDASGVALGLGLLFWLGFAGSLGLLAAFLVAWRRNRLTRHLMGVAAENDLRRRFLEEQYGLAVTDREFATGQAALYPPPEGAPSPQPPPVGQSDR